MKRNAILVCLILVVMGLNDGCTYKNFLKPKLDVYHLHYFPANMGRLRELTIYKDSTYLLTDMWVGKFNSKEVLSFGEVKVFNDSILQVGDSLFLQMKGDTLFQKGWRSFVPRKKCHFSD